MARVGSLRERWWKGWSEGVCSRCWATKAAPWGQCIPAEGLAWAKTLRLECPCCFLPKLIPPPFQELAQLPFCPWGPLKGTPGTLRSLIRHSPVGKAERYRKKKVSVESKQIYSQISASLTSHTWVPWPFQTWKHHTYKQRSGGTSKWGNVHKVLAHSELSANRSFDPPHSIWHELHSAFCW